MTSKSYKEREKILQMQQNTIAFKFDFCKKMKIFITLMIFVGYITAVSSCPDCTLYIRRTGVPSLIPDTYECTESCNFTFNEFVQNRRDCLYLKASLLACSRMEFIFQSGIHYVPIHVPKRLLTFANFASLVIRGESNAIIKCWSASYCLIFDSVQNVVIRNIHIWNCSCSHYHYHHHGTELTGVYQSSNAKIEAINCRFTNSKLILLFQYIKIWLLKYFTPQSLYTEVAIKDSKIENCESKNRRGVESFLTIDIMFSNNFNYKLLNITLENINFTGNKLSFIAARPNRNGYVTCVFIVFTGCNYFTRNTKTIITATSDDTVCRQDHSMINRFLFSKTEVYVTDNAVQGSPFSIYGIITFEHCRVLFSGNYGTDSGGIRIYEQQIKFYNYVLIEFNNNVGQKGGALFLSARSAMIFNTTKSIVISFKNNSAWRGGAIFVEDSSSVKPIFSLWCRTKLVKLKFSNNSALFGGNQIYGGWVDWFGDKYWRLRYMPNTTKKILKFESSSDSEVASCPIRICLCVDGHPDCNITRTTMEIYGYAFSLDLVAVGQRFTPVYAHVRTTLAEKSNAEDYDEPWKHFWPISASLQTTCTNIIYKFYSSEVVLLLKPFLNSRQCKPHRIPMHNAIDSVTAQALVLFQQLSIHLKHKNCPLGFKLHETDLKCICQPSLLSLDLSCDLDSAMICRNKQQWIGIAREHILTSYEGPEVIVHQHCPFDYCRMDNDSLLIHLEDQSMLCAFNRSGILCGGCESNFSRVLGSSKCEVCSMNFKLFSIFLGWLLSGLILVLLLMMLDLTVSIGTINGLTFYANIIQAQHATFFTLDFSSSLPSKFITWLNLDQGIEICLYDGLDDYTITWLQFLFPLYIWLIAAALIVTSHYSTRVSRLIGNNAVQVLATLFLITYAKLLRLIIDVFSFTTITYPDGYKKTVWLIDGNVEYFKGRHIPLVVVTAIFVLFSLPYTLILLTIQFLYKISHYHVMFWIQRLKPFFDAYTGPYRANHRYWTGLLLIARILLLTSFSLNQSNKPAINLFVITAFTFALLIWLYFTKWVYESFLNNCLEMFFLCNLGLTAITTLFDLSDSNRSPVVIYTSTGMAFVVFVGIILYHALRRLLLSRVGARLKKSIQAVFSTEREINDDHTLQVNGPNLNVQPSGKVTCTVVELTQPLLDEEGDGDMAVKESL